MNEITKTSVFVAVAAVVLMALLVSHWLGASWTPELDPKDMVGKLLFDDFNPLDVTDLEIIKYDENAGQLVPFQVAQVNNRWSIPSHANYPADAKDQLAEAATSVMGRLVLSVEGDNPADHAMFGVVDPGAKDFQAGSVGVGTRVTMKSADGKILLALVVGKEVKGQTGLRYVRRVGQDPVYTMELGTDKLSTKFEDWIEADLLKLNTWDIVRMDTHDHSVDEAQQTINQRAEMALEYNDTGDPRWKMLSDQQFVVDHWEPVQMAADEEINTSKLDEMKNALDDLKIVDVRRKPEGLSRDLKAEKDFSRSDEAYLSLASKGFYLAPLGGQVQVVSNEGDIRCLTKEGVEYVLRFGNVTEAASGQTKDAKDGKDVEDAKEGEEANKDDKQESPDLNRYIFVMAQFNQDGVPKPKLEPLPEEQNQPKDAKEQDSKPQDPKDDKPAEGAAGGAKTTESPAKPNDSSAAPSAAPSESPAPTIPAEKPAAQPAEPERADAQQEADQKTDAQADQKAPAQADQKVPAEADQKGPAKSASGTDAERERIEKENKRKQDEYEQKIDSGKKKVNELNDRFADWYYVISDEVYQKIHLGRDQIVRRKEKKEADNKAGGAAAVGTETQSAGAAGESTDPDSAAPGEGGQPAVQEPAESPGPVGESRDQKEQGPAGSGDAPEIP